MGPVTDRAAATSPDGPKIGAATQLTPMLPSSRSTAQPLAGTAVSSRITASLLVSVRGVRAGSPASSTASMVAVSL